MTIPCAIYTHAGSVRLRFPYSRRLVERLKRQVPPYARSYAPEDKAWTVTAGYAARAVRLLRTIDGDGWVRDVRESHRGHAAIGLDQLGRRFRLGCHGGRRSIGPKFERRGFGRRGPQVTA